VRLSGLLFVFVGLFFVLIAVVLGKRLGRTSMR